MHTADMTPRPLLSVLGRPFFIASPFGFALFDSQAHGEAARDLIRAEFPQQSVGANCCLHYAAREPIEQESKSDTGFTEFLAKMIQNSVNGGNKHNE